MIGITGSTGFIGSNLCDMLESKNYKIFKYTRSKESIMNNSYRFFDMSQTNQENLDISDVSIFIHIAGKAHGNFSSEIGNEEYSCLKQLLNLCQKNNIKKFIYMSSVSVYGLNFSEKHVHANSTPNPQNEYAKSKLRCEKYIEEFCIFNNINFIIIRSPIVLCADAPGNLNKLKKVLNKKIPLPFKSLKNKKSVISINHLTEFIFSLIAEGSFIKNRVVLVCSKDSMSTREIIEWLCKKLDIPFYLFGNFDFPKFLKRNNFFGKLIGNLEFTGKKIKFTNSIDLNSDIDVYACNSSK